MYGSKEIFRLVVKLGTESLSSCMEGKKELNQNLFDDFARQIMEARKLGVDVAIVSSGAIRAGEERIKVLGLEPGPLERKHIAGIGARHLMSKWGKAFECYGWDVAQIWVTYASLSHNGEQKSIRESILRYLKHGAIIPVVNENDVLSDEEIRWMEQGISENDNLAQKIAFLITADAVLFITTEKGVYKDNPKNDPNAEIYTEIDCNQVPSFSGSSVTSDGGAGGMGAKIKAALECARAGKRVSIVGCEENMITRFVKDLPIGTKIRCSH